MTGWRELGLGQVGGWRSSLCWRVFGWSVFQLWIQNLGRKELGPYFSEFPAEFHVFSLGGLVLLLLGPRVPILLTLAVSGIIFLRGLIPGTNGVDFIADEYLFQVATPTIALVLLAVLNVRAGRAGRGAPAPRTLDESWTWWFRALVLTTLLFATFHKINTDFLDPTVSCANLSARLSEWWPMPSGMGRVSPALVVFMEGLCPVLLLVWPRVGILYTVIFIAGMAHIGPTAFAMMVVALSLGNLQPGDAVVLRRLLRPLALPYVALLAGGSVLSYSVFTGPQTWIRFLFFQLVAFSVLYWVGALLVVRGRQLRRRIRVRGRDALRRALLPRWFRRGPTWKNPTPALSSWLVLGLLVNGMTPYFGVKYRFSVAMLSNLRADEDRWNHPLVPRLLYLRDHDPFVHVEGVDPAPPRIKSRKQQPMVQDGAFAPHEFRARWEESRRRGHRASLRLRYLGQSRTVDDLSTDLRLAELASSLPTRRLFQSSLDPGPQRCIH